MTLDKEPNHVSAVVGLGVFVVALLSKAAESPPPPQAERRGIHHLLREGDGRNIKQNS